MRGNAGPFLLLLLVLCLLGGFAWLTWNPGTPWLEEAEEWPLVGALASRFRTAYLGPEAAGGSPAETTETSHEGRIAAAEKPAGTRRAPVRPPAPAPSSKPEGPREASPEPPRAEPLVLHLPQRPNLPEIPGQPADSSSLTHANPATSIAIAPRSPLEDINYKIDGWFWVLPGNRILASAEAGGEVIEHLAAMSYLPILGRDGNWVQVLHRERQGWVDATWEPPHQRRKARRGILRQRYEPVRGSDTRRLKQARKILGIDRPSVKLGAYTLYTDVDDEELLGFLDLAAGTAEEAYYARYGRLPSGDPKRSVVLFAREADYRQYSPNLSGNQAGHAGSGVLAFYAEGRSRQDLARTLVHEIGHLLNARALALRLPPWLQEGIATDLGSLWVEGTPAAEMSRRPGDWSFQIAGPEVRILQLASTLEAGQLPSVAVLMSLDYKKFQSSPAYAYAHSAALVRYLSDSPDGRQGEAFRRFLERIAAGQGAEPRLLLRLLGMEIEELDQGFRGWLQAEGEIEAGRLAEKMEQRLVRRKPF